MSWSLRTESKPRARKAYECDACEWLVNVGTDDLSDDELTLYEQAKNRNETGSNLSLGTRLTVLSKRLGRKRCCDATPDRCLGGVPSHYLRFAL